MNSVVSLSENGTVMHALGTSYIAQRALINHKLKSARVLSILRTGDQLQRKQAMSKLTGNKIKCPSFTRY